MITSDHKENKSVVDQLTQKGKTIDLSTVTEGDLGEAKEEDRKLCKLSSTQTSTST